MNSERLNPPELALWLLLHLSPKRNREAITGDIVERFREGRSDGWFWRQALLAILVGASSELSRHWMEMGCAGAATALLWYFPPARMLSIGPGPASMNWDGLQWFIVTEIKIAPTAALIVLPLFATVFRLRGTFSYASLFRFFLICATLFAVGDLPLFFWLVRHHGVISRSQATWVMPILLGWQFVRLLISAILAERLLFPPKAVRT